MGSMDTDYTEMGYTLRPSGKPAMRSSHSDMLSDEAMKVMVIGSGGREHALCKSLALSPLVRKIYCAPGNDGIALDAEIVPLAVDALDDICEFATGQQIDLVVVGPELPLVLGLVDRLRAAGVRVFGPSAAAARLEGSKEFMKSFAARHRIPTAAHETFSCDQRAAALDYVASRPLPIVIKADGLAAGKGVTVAETRKAATEAVEAAFDGQFGEAGRTLVVEEFLEGEEASLFALCDGSTALEIGTAQDHKRAHDGDQGPNTGGMGAYSPAPILDAAMVERVMAEIIQPTLGGMAAEGNPFAGFLYAGLMIGPDGPKLVEFNVRFGDPECQAVLPRLTTDLCALLTAACDGALDRMDIHWSNDHALTVVMAARGYPGAYEKGTEIRGLESLAVSPHVSLCHAGTVRKDDRWLAAGGRVLNVTGHAESLKAARDHAYHAIDSIDWPNGFCRTDIGWRALAGS